MLLLVLKVMAPLVIFEILQPLVLSLLFRPLDIMSASFVMPIIIACLRVLFDLASIVASEVLVIISLTVSKILTIEILVLSPRLLLLEFPLLLLPFLL